MPPLLAWDIGGVNIKAVFLDAGAIQSATRYFEIWRHRDGLEAALRDLAGRFPSIQAMGATMTAELSDAYRTKREGVAHIVESLVRAFPGVPLHIFSVHGDFLPPDRAVSDPLAVAAANWAATAALLSERFPDCILVDIGSTTTDIIPIIGGKVAAMGQNDPERLASGELVYTGVLRTPVASLASRVPWRGRWCPVSPEYFATSADVHLLLENIRPDQYTCTTADGRDKTARLSAERLARAICADSEILSEAEIRAMASYLEDEQVTQIARAVALVLSRIAAQTNAISHNCCPVKAGETPLVVTGTGAFLARKTAGRLGLQVVDLEAGAPVGTPVGTPATAMALALLLDRRLRRQE